MLQSLLHLIVMRKGNEVCYQQRRYGGQQHISEELERFLLTDVLNQPVDKNFSYPNKSLKKPLIIPGSITPKFMMPEAKA